VNRHFTALPAASGLWIGGIGQAKPEGPKLEARRDGVLGQVAARPSPPSRSPGRRRVYLYSVPSDCLSQHLSACCIQFAWLGIRVVRTDINEI